MPLSVLLHCQKMPGWRLISDVGSQGLPGAWPLLRLHRTEYSGIFLVDVRVDRKCQVMLLTLAHFCITVAKKTAHFTLQYYLQIAGLQQHNMVNRLSVGGFLFNDYSIIAVKYDHPVLIRQILNSKVTIY